MLSLPKNLYVFSLFVSLLLLTPTTVLAMEEVVVIGQRIIITGPSNGIFDYSQSWVDINGDFMEVPFEEAPEDNAKGNVLCGSFGNENGSLDDGEVLMLNFALTMCLAGLVAAPPPTTPIAVAAVAACLFTFTATLDQACDD